MLSSFLIAVSLPATPQYLETRRVHHADIYHNITVQDPYRWLENDVRVDNEVNAWVEGQIQLTRGYLNGLEYRNAIAERLKEIWNYPRFGVPCKIAGRYYFFANNGLQNQSVLYTMECLDEEPAVLIDPNTWSEDGTIALGGISFSDDGRYMSYAITNAGSDWKSWKIRDLQAGKDLEDTIEWSKFRSPVWMPDGSAFYYCRYNEPKEGGAFQDQNIFMKIYRHEPGTSPAEDRLILEDKNHPTWLWSPSLSEDGRWLVVSVFSEAGASNLVKVCDLSNSNGQFVDLINDWNDKYTFVTSIKDILFFITNKDAPRRRLLAMDMSRMIPAWLEIIPEQDATLNSVQHLHDSFIVNYIKDASTQIKRYAEDGSPMGDIQLPGIGSAGGFTGRSDDAETFYYFTSFTTSPTIYHLDLTTGTSRILWKTEVDFKPADYEVEQVFYSGKDGTRVPMFLVHRCNMIRNGQVPTLLYGYGGFNLSLTPHFSPAYLAWVEMGCLLAIPNLRGGGEYGRDWHEAGTKTRKQNVFDDFIAAAEWLIEQNYTNPNCLAIQGASNGGLLVGACMTQRPDLYRACLPAMGVMDMLRFHLFTIGSAWQGEYGDITDPKIFQSLYAFSPYHNIKPGIAYPATLITTADTDDRVVPMHSFKFAAALQHAQVGDNPVLIRIDRKTGHGMGRPIWMRIAKIADEWAFVVNSLGIKPIGPVSKGQQPALLSNDP